MLFEEWWGCAVTIVYAKTVWLWCRFDELRQDITDKIFGDYVAHLSFHDNPRYPLIEVVCNGEANESKGDISLLEKYESAVIMYGLMVGEIPESKDIVIGADYSSG